MLCQDSVFLLTLDLALDVIDYLVVKVWFLK